MVTSTNGFIVSPNSTNFWTNNIRLVGTNLTMYVSNGFLYIGLTNAGPLVANYTNRFYASSNGVSFGEITNINFSSGFTLLTNANGNLSVAILPSSGVASNGLVYVFAANQFLSQSITNIFLKSGAQMTNPGFFGTITGYLADIGTQWTNYTLQQFGWTGTNGSNFTLQIGAAITNSQIQLSNALRLVIGGVSTNLTNIALHKISDLDGFGTNTVLNWPTIVSNFYLGSGVMTNWQWQHGLNWAIQTLGTNAGNMLVWMKHTNNLNLSSPWTFFAGSMTVSNAVFSSNVWAPNFFTTSAIATNWINQSNNNFTVEFIGSNNARHLWMLYSNTPAATAGWITFRVAINLENELWAQNIYVGDGVRDSARNTALQYQDGYFHLYKVSNEAWLQRKDNGEEDTPARLNFLDPVVIGALDTTPLEKLDVRGSLRVTTNGYFGGNVLVSNTLTATTLVARANSFFTGPLQLIDFTDEDNSTYVTQSSVGLSFIQNGVLQFLITPSSIRAYGSNDIGTQWTNYANAIGAGIAGTAWTNYTDQQVGKLGTNVTNYVNSIVVGSAFIGSLGGNGTNTTFYGGITNTAWYFGNGAGVTNLLQFQSNGNTLAMTNDRTINLVGFPFMTNSGSTQHLGFTMFSNSIYLGSGVAISNYAFQLYGLLGTNSTNYAFSLGSVYSNYTLAIALNGTNNVAGLRTAVSSLSNAFIANSNFVLVVAANTNWIKNTNGSHTGVFITVNTNGGDDQNNFSIMGGMSQIWSNSAGDVIKAAFRFSDGSVGGGLRADPTSVSFVGNGYIYFQGSLENDKLAAYVQDGNFIVNGEGGGIFRSFVPGQFDSYIIFTPLEDPPASSGFAQAFGYGNDLYAYNAGGQLYRLTQDPFIWIGSNATILGAVTNITFVGFSLMTNTDGTLFIGAPVGSVRDTYDNSVPTRFYTNVGSRIAWSGTNLVANNLTNFGNTVLNGLLTVTNIYIAAGVTQSTAVATSVGSASGTIEDSGTTIGGFGAEMYNTVGSALHDNSSNNGRLKAPIDGLYKFTAGFWFTNSALGSRGISFRRNSSAALIPGLQVAPNPGGATFVQATITLKLVATEYVEMVAYQDSASTLVNSNYNRAYFTIERIGSSTGASF